MKRFIGLLLLLIFTAGCSDKQKDTHRYTPQVIDPTDMLSGTLKSEFLDYDYPENVFPVLVAIGDIENSMEVGCGADDIFDDLSKDEKNFPGFEEHALLVAVTLEPELVQLRVGEEYSTYCRFAGKTHGGEYLELQKNLMAEESELSLTPFLDLASAGIAEWNGKTKIEKSQTLSCSIVADLAVGHIGTPSENPHTRLFLKPIISALSTLHHKTGGWWLSLIIFFCIASLFEYIVSWCLNKVFKSKVCNIIADIAITTVLAYAASAAVSILSSGRMEDIIALEHLGIPFISEISADMTCFNKIDSFWIVALLSWIWGLAFLLDHNYFLAHLPSELQSKINKDMFPETGESADDKSAGSPFTIQLTYNIIEYMTISLIAAIIVFFIAPEIFVIIGIAIGIPKLAGNLILLFQFFITIEKELRVHVLKRIPLSTLCLILCAVLSTAAGYALFCIL